MATNFASSSASSSSSSASAAVSSGGGDNRSGMCSSDRVKEMMTVMDAVYGRYEDESQGGGQGGQWRPKAYIEGHKGRYLWTDAYGVCNYLTLYKETHQAKYLQQAQALIDDVHNTLGKQRSGDKRLKNATDQNPLNGGLRIGKPNQEEDDDGDGQYFHYLTKWMFCLNRMSLMCRNSKYNEWAIQLAKAIHPHFVYNRHTNRPRMFWKMSIDLSRPMVQSEGNLDPFDGYVTYRLLQETSGDSKVLVDEIKDMQLMVQNKYQQYRSMDPLDLGESLWITHWYVDEPWANHVTKVALAALDKLWVSGYFDAAKRYRLAFREYGTTIGVQVNPLADKGKWASRVEKLHEFWRPYLFDRDRDITPVMFATSLCTGSITKGYL